MWGFQKVSTSSRKAGKCSLHRENYNFFKILLVSHFFIFYFLFFIFHSLFFILLLCAVFSINQDPLMDCFHLGDRRMLKEVEEKEKEVHDFIILFSRNLILILFIIFDIYLNLDIETLFHHILFHFIFIQFYFSSILFSSILFMKEFMLVCNLYQ